MPKAKKTKKVKLMPRTDANQGIREHNEKLKKQAEYRQRKMEEFQEMLEKMKKEQEEKDKPVISVVENPKAEETEQPLDLTGAFTK